MQFFCIIKGLVRFQIWTIEHDSHLQQRVPRSVPIYIQKWFAWTACWWIFFDAILWKKTSSNGPEIVTSKVAFLILPVSVRKAFSIARKQHMSWNSWTFASHGCMVLVNIQSRKNQHHFLHCVLVIWICCVRCFSTLLVLIAWVPGFPGWHVMLGPFSTSIAAASYCLSISQPGEAAVVQCKKNMSPLWYWGSEPWVTRDDVYMFLI